METNEEALARIIAGFNSGMSDSRKIKSISEKIASGKATYADAYAYARESGRIMTGSMKKHIPEVLTDGKLFREAAEKVIGEPMRINGKKVSKTAAEIQTGINEQAGIGMNGIEVGLNDDQITGIITGIANAESYDQGSGRMFDQVENFMEGVVDDAVRENADFQYRAGLDPKVIRTAAGKCCTWCSNLAGVYNYEDVRDKGNDVWRRHRDCHCVIEYDPGKKGGKREIVSGPRSTDPGKADRIAAAEGQTEGYYKNPSYNSKADPMAEAFGRGVDSHPEEIKAFREECRQAGVKVIERDHESLSYQPSPIVGQPGQLTVNPNASYGAWSHEMKHMRDDRESGWDGAMRLWDKDDHARREEEAYAIEIGMAEAAGRNDIADRLRENLDAERRRIYGSP